MADPLPPEIAEAMASRRARLGAFGDPLHYFQETGSTNDVAAALADRGAAEGTTVVAAAQTSGRGRFGRAWFSPPGAGLYVSVVCRNRAAAPLLTLAGGVAVADGVRAATGLPVQIKWPNDNVVESGRPPRRRKLAGILAEGSSGADGLHHVILGFGINVRTAAYPPALADSATSIETELGRDPDSGAILAETLAALAGRVAELASGRPGPLLTRWRALAPSAHGTSVAWDTPGGPRHGTAAGLADDGALLVQVGDRVERIISGEVRWS